MSPRYAQARQWYAINCLAPLGQFQRARAELQQAAELEPVSLAIATSLGVLKFFERHYDQAIAQFQSVLEMDEGFAAAHYFIGQACMENGLHADAIRELERAVLLTDRSSETIAMLGYAQAAAGFQSGSEGCHFGTFAESHPKVRVPSIALANTDRTARI